MFSKDLVSRGLDSYHAKLWTVSKDDNVGFGCFFVDEEEAIRVKVDEHNDNLEKAIPTHVLWTQKVPSHADPDTNYLLVPIPRRTRRRAANKSSLELSLHIHTFRDNNTTTHYEEVPSMYDFQSRVRSAMTSSLWNNSRMALEIMRIEVPEEWVEITHAENVAVSIVQQVRLVGEDNYRLTNHYAVTGYAEKSGLVFSGEEFGGAHDIEPQLLPIQEAKVFTRNSKTELVTRINGNN